MPNIFDGLEKMDDEKLRYQIATLETVTIANVTSEMGQKAGKGSIKFVNSISGMFNGRQYSEPEVVSIEGRITLAKQNLDEMDRVGLNARLKQLLMDKVKAGGIFIDSNPSYDEISVAVIETAAKRYKNEISESLSPAQKADAIRYRYHEKLMEQSQKSLKKQTEEQKQKTEEEIQKKINNMTGKQQEELQKALKVDVLTGNTVRQILSTTAGTTAAMIALDVSGFGAYMALTTIMHAVFTTTLGITLPFAAYSGATTVLAFITGPVGWITLLGVQVFMINSSKNKLIYELMAQVVWGSIVEYGKKFTPSDEELPSWLPDMERDIANKESEELMRLMNENAKLQSQQQSLEDKLAKNKEIMQKDSVRINALNAKITEVQNRNERIQEEKFEAERKLADAATLFIEAKERFDEKAKQNIESDIVEKEEYERLIAAYEEAQSELKMKENEMMEVEELALKFMEEKEETQKEKEELLARSEILENENEQLTEERRKSEELLNKKLEKNAKELEQRWTVAFNRIKFEPGVTKYVFKHFQHNELGDIEALLVEMQGTNDPMSLKGNRGNMSDGSAHIEFSTPSGFPGRIIYKVDKKRYPGKLIVVSDIMKHNDSRYGK
jgi:uncharacterized protein YaaW (UPF0174 family)